MTLRRGLVALAFLALSACATVSAAPPPSAPLPGWTVAAAATRPVGLGLPFGAALDRSVRFAGGVEIVLDEASPLHSLSDFKLTGDGGGFISVTDAGDLVRGRLVLSSRDRLTGVADLQYRRLTLLDGAPITEKVDGDAEGLLISTDGELYISFERRHRIWNYGAPDAPHARPTPVRHPDVEFPLNDGMEGISTGQAGGWRVTGENGGVWDCRPAACVVVTPVPAVPATDADFRTTGLDRDPSGPGYYVLQRLFREPADVRAQVRHMAMDGTLGPVLVELKFPGTTDNFEGLAAVAHNGGARLYILSDDNASKKQRTLLLAFDVRHRE
ncbi:esterase-like activity of phytase family protein [Brevundimonas sp.]|uniref:esterase-like activity of phytase family protein n=1 Tax=Brevundimonas sp. TaxID=1871086 RepID=UPI003F6FBAD6